MIQRYFRLAGYLLPVFIVCTSLALLGAQAKPSGSDAFVPTKREWLLVKFNAEHRLDFFNGVTIQALPGDGPNQIRLVGLFDKNANRANFNRSFQDARRALENEANRHGFDAWLVIKEVIELVGN